jgi:hypothetical protein
MSDSLHVVDGQTGQVILFDAKGEKPADLPSFVGLFEQMGGNVHKFCQFMGWSDIQLSLFRVEEMLAQPDNAEYRRRWKRAYDRHVITRLRINQLKALDKLDNINDEDKQTDAINFAKLVLGEYFTAQIQTAKTPKSGEAPDVVPGQAEDEDAALERARQDFDGT